MYDGWNDFLQGGGGGNPIKTTTRPTVGRRCYVMGGGGTSIDANPKVSSKNPTNRIKNKKKQKQHAEMSGSVGGGKKPRSTRV